MYKWMDVLAGGKLVVVAADVCWAAGGGGEFYCLWGVYCAACYRQPFQDITVGAARRHGGNNNQWPFGLPAAGSRRTGSVGLANEQANGSKIIVKPW